MVAPVRHKSFIDSTLSRLRSDGLAGRLTKIALGTLDTLQLVFPDLPLQSAHKVASSLSNCYHAQEVLEQGYSWFKGETQEKWQCVAAKVSKVAANIFNSILFFAKIGGEVLPPLKIVTSSLFLGSYLFSLIDDVGELIRLSRNREENAQEITKKWVSVASHAAAIASAVLGILFLTTPLGTLVPLYALYVGLSFLSNASDVYNFAESS